LILIVKCVTQQKKY
jgi:hypothetical protein